jgi:hypothetical protein
MGLLHRLWCSSPTREDFQVAAISTRMPSVAVEYDCKGKRKTKEFGTDAYAAKRFYQAKLKAGKHPCIKKGAEA